MSQILLSDVREKFINYFKKNNHQIIDSSNLVPNNDPTLMFTNSGMEQVENIMTSKMLVIHLGTILFLKC